MVYIHIYIIERNLSRALVLCILTDDHAELVFTCSSFHVSAVADDMYGYATTSWYLAETVSHIELNTEGMTEEEMAKVEETANQKIREATPVTIVEFEASDPGLKKVCVRFVCSSKLYAAVGLTAH